MLTTARLTIRPFVLDDLDALHAIYGDREVMRWVDGDYSSVDATRAALETHIAMHALDGFAFWAVETRATGDLVGEVGFGRLGHEIEMGWTFARSAWGKGYATEAGLAALRHAPREHVIAVIREENVASQRVATKLGFERSEKRAVRGTRQLIYTRTRGANVPEYDL